MQRYVDQQLNNYLLTYLLTLLCILWSDTTFHETLLEYTWLTANEALSDADDEDDLRG